MDYDWKKIARDAAMALPPSDYGSSRAIEDVARLLAEAYARGLQDAAAQISMSLGRPAP